MNSIASKALLFFFNLFKFFDFEISVGDFYQRQSMPQITRWGVFSHEFVATVCVQPQHSTAPIRITYRKDNGNLAITHNRYNGFIASKKKLISFKSSRASRALWLQIGLKFKRCFVSMDFHCFWSLGFLCGGFFSSSFCYFENMWRLCCCHFFLLLLFFRFCCCVCLNKAPIRRAKSSENIANALANAAAGHTRN